MFYMEGFFVALWLLIVDWCNGVGSSYYCVLRILTLFPLGAAQAGAIDVISFPEARGEDPVAIQCLSAVLKR